MTEAQVKAAGQAIALRDECDFLLREIGKTPVEKFDLVDLDISMSHSVGCEGLAFAEAEPLRVPREVAFKVIEVVRLYANQRLIDLGVS